MYACDFKATVDMAVSDMVGSNSQLKQVIAIKRKEKIQREDVF